MPDFDGKVVLVTGSGSGIGRASATAFAREGAIVAVADINEEAGRGTVDAILGAGGSAEFFPVDVSSESRVAECLAAVVTRFGALDVAHNNAGIDGQVASLMDTSFTEWQKILSVNLSSVFLCMKAEIGHMLGRGGTIVNTASLSGLTGGYNHGAYTAAKHGVVGVTKAVALEYIDQGIRINAICPGAINTPFMLDLPDDLVNQLVGGTPANRLAEPAEIAEAVLWLASAKSSYVVGHALAVDGGIFAGGTATRF